MLHGWYTAGIPAVSFLGHAYRNVWLLELVRVSLFSISISASADLRVLYIKRLLPCGDYFHETITYNRQFSKYARRTTGAGSIPLTHLSATSS